MTERGRRTVPFAGEVVGVEWSGGLARRVADLALGALGDGDPRLPESVFRLGAHRGASTLTLFGDRTCLYRGESAGTAAHLLLQGVLDRLVSGSRSGLVLHAGLVARGGGGVLLPGPTGSGKTMLSAWLSLRGCAPLSDEACYLADDGGLCESFARPFCFKGTWVEPLGLAALDRDDVLVDAGVSLVPGRLLATPSAGAVAPRLIVFPRYRVDAAFELTRLTPARAAVRLIESVANARNLPGHGVARVTDLVRAVECYSLTYGHFDQLDALADLVAAVN